MDDLDNNQEDFFRQREVRHAGLIRKWTEGKQLSREEVFELADIVPPSLLAIPPPFDVSKNNYIELYETYAERYATSVRSIKRWVAAGRQAKDLCPLDQPPLMVDWWTRCMRRAVPDVLYGFVKVPPSPPPVAPRVAAVPPPRATDTLEIGLEATHRRLQRAEAVASSAYTTALENPDEDENRLQRLAKRWQDCVENLRRVERDLIDNRKKSGDVITRAELRQALAPIHSTIVTGLRGFLRRVRPKLATCSSAAAEDALWSAELDNLFKAWQDSQFSPQVDERTRAA